jgi:hypothetical protein
MKLSSDYLPMFSGYLPIFRRGTQLERSESSVNRQMISQNRQILPMPPSMPNLPIICRFFRPIYRFALAENERANRSSRKPATLDWQPILKVEHYRLKQDSVKHPVELKEDSPPYIFKAH